MTLCAKSCKLPERVLVEKRVILKATKWKRKQNQRAKWDAEVKEAAESKLAAVIEKAERAANCQKVADAELRRIRITNEEQEFHYVCRSCDSSVKNRSVVTVMHRANNSIRIKSHMHSAVQTI